MGVSAEFLAAVSRALASRHGDRMGSYKEINRYIELLAEAEAVWQSLPPCPPPPPADPPGGGGQCPEA